ncbi:hypothetical protein TrVFT333_002842 [Trichoderma virens FT-333]|nr:hypothetical protein TrVFT333_002842 [Trichoderma virens FT-333]
MPGKKSAKNRNKKRGQNKSKDVQQTPDPSSDVLQEPAESTDEQQELAQSSGMQPEPEQGNGIQQEPAQSRDEQQELVQSTDIQQEPLVSRQQEPYQTISEQQEPLVSGQEELTQSGGIQQEPVQSTDIQQEPPVSVQQEPYQTINEQQEPLVSGQREPVQSSGIQQEPVQSSYVQQEAPASVQQEPYQTINKQQELPVSGQQEPVETTDRQQEPDQSPDKHQETLESVRQEPAQSGSIQQQPVQSSYMQRKPVRSTDIPQGPSVSGQQEPYQAINKQQGPLESVRQESGQNTYEQQKPDTGGAYSDEQDRVSPQDWHEILQRTGALKGWVPRDDNGNIIVALAPEQLFKLKTEMPEWTTSSGSKRDSIPFQNATEKNFLRAAFDTSAIETTVQASTPAGGGFARNTRDNVPSEHFEDVKLSYLFHEFPLATVNLPSSSLLPSQSFLDFIKNSLDQYSGLIPPTTSPDRDALSSILREFQYLFGAVFAKQVLLGGRRHAIQKIQRHSQAKVQSLEEKNAINASLNVPLTVGSLKAGGERSWRSASGDDSGSVSIDVNSLVIDGGNETLIDDVEAWQTTLQSSKDWKVIKQNDVTALLPFLIEVLEKTEPKYEYIDFVRGLDNYAQELRQAQERDLTAVFEPLALWISSSYTPKSRNFFANLFGKKPKWTVMLNTDKPKMIDRVQVKILGYYKNGNDRFAEFGGFPDAFPVSIDLPTPTSKETTAKYEVEFNVVLKPNYEWRKSERESPAVILKLLDADILDFGVSLGPKSTSITAEYNVYTK